MTVPNKDIEDILYQKQFDSNKLSDFTDIYDFINLGDFKKINWLNTPGPIYTTITDNCGTGQAAAIHNVGGDEDYREIIFKQPFSRQELKETLTAAAIDPLGAYYFDGNLNWTKTTILKWWNKSDDRIKYIVDRYREELNLPDPLYRPLYGPRSAIPENYKYWLDFYQFYMKEYLEWYHFKIHNQPLALPILSFDWTKRSELDKLFHSKS
jgi:hypothetical protein